VLHRQQGAEQADDPGAGDQDMAPADPVGHAGGRPGQGGRRVQQPVDADRPHLRQVDTQQRLEVVGHRDDDGARWIGAAAGAVAVGHRDQRALDQARGVALDDPPDLHVAQARDRVAGERGPGDAERPQLAVPAHLVMGVGAPDERDLGARADPAP
jgi:hypothetical protein